MIRMLSSLRIALLAALAFAGLPSLPALAQAPNQRDSADTIIEGFAFPPSIAGLVRGEPTTYTQRGYGFSMRYASRPESWADIYIYDKELDLSSPSQAALKAEMTQVLYAILATQERGSYDEAKVRSATLEKNLASARLTVKSNGSEHISFAFLTIAHGKFVKIRFSTRDMKTGQKRADAFRSAAFGLIRKTAPAIQPRRDPRFI